MLFRSGDQIVELLPSPQALDSPAAKGERELLKRIQSINQYVEQQNGERLIAQVLAHELQLSLSTVVQERQQLRVGYGQYAAMRGLSYLGRGSIRNIVADYHQGIPWSEMAQTNGSRINDLTTWLGNLVRTTNAAGRQFRSQQYPSSSRTP